MAPANCSGITAPNDSLSKLEEITACMAGLDGALGAGEDDDRFGADDVTGLDDDVVGAVGVVVRAVDVAAVVLGTAVELGAEGAGGFGDAVEGALRAVVAVGEVLDGAVELGVLEVSAVVLAADELVGGSAEGGVVVSTGGGDEVGVDGTARVVDVTGALDVAVRVLAGRVLDRGGRGFDLETCRSGAEPRARLGVGIRPSVPLSPESTPKTPSTVSGSHHGSLPPRQNDRDEWSARRWPCGPMAPTLLPATSHSPLGVGVRYACALGVASMWEAAVVGASLEVAIRTTDGEAARISAAIEVVIARQYRRVEFDPIPRR